MRKARILDVARRAGVSTATVSHVINGTRLVSEETRQKVLKAMRELDYHPSAIARSLKTKTTGTIGVIVSDVSNPFFTAVVRGLEDMLNEGGYNLILCNTDEDPVKEERYLKVLLSKRIDGLVMAPTGEKSRTLEVIHAAGTPIVFIDRGIDFLDCPTIWCRCQCGAESTSNGDYWATLRE